MTNISGPLIQAKNTGKKTGSLIQKATPKTDNPLFVGSVEKAFSVLQAFSQHRKSLSLKEISEITGIGKSAAQRFCYTLVELGFLERDESSRRMRPSARLLGLSHSYLASNPISSIAAPYLLQARENSGEAVNLGIPMDQDVIYIARLASTNSHIAHPIVGGRAPMFCTSSGRAYLSTLSQNEINDLLDDSDLTPITRHTITDRQEILGKIDDVLNKGYAMANQECIVGELTIAAPILGPDHKGIGSVNICVTRPAWTMESVEEKLAPIVCQTAHNITLALSN
ncbi:IclR family transcriptional regulator [Kiloniella litopenaei]|uniref:IclR family transcriptional regulator n=1 Tax=Kiloniella litopenaei TaxID=1549748 RepID=UPI0006980E91|nr:IclR family transcriptional regulator [Kiloniella litopenaei]